MSEKPIRRWDSIDKSAAAEGAAISRMNSYRTDDESEGHTPKRLFPDGVCYAIERMSSEEYKNLVGKTSIPCQLFKKYMW